MSMEIMSIAGEYRTFHYANAAHLRELIYLMAIFVILSFDEFIEIECV